MVSPLFHVNITLQEMFDPAAIENVLSILTTAMYYKLESMFVCCYTSNFTSLK